MKKLSYDTLIKIIDTIRENIIQRKLKDDEQEINTDDVINITVNSLDDAKFGKDYLNLIKDLLVISFKSDFNVRKIITEILKYKVKNNFISNSIGKIFNVFKK